MGCLCCSMRAGETCSVCSNDDENNNEPRYRKPPLGVMPKKLWIEHRLKASKTLREMVMNDLIDEMSLQDCVMQINALFLSRGFEDDELIHMTCDDMKSAFRKILRGLMKIDPESRKIMIDGVNLR